MTIVSYFCAASIVFFLLWEILVCGKGYFVACVKRSVYVGSITLGLGLSIVELEENLIKCDQPPSAGRTRKKGAFAPYYLMLIK
jgi:hypothetical protein